MTGTMMVASGPATGPLRDMVAADVAAGVLGQVHAGSHLVVWDARSRWVQADDDGDVLVVLDGRVHAGLTAVGGTSASALRRRYRLVQSGVARGVLGDFVLVVLDRSRDRLLVARDPVGVRPWYQAERGGTMPVPPWSATCSPCPGWTARPTR